MDVDHQDGDSKEHDAIGYKRTDEAYLCNSNQAILDMLSEPHLVEDGAICLYGCCNADHEERYYGANRP
jgi:hypothetical protein